MFGSRPPLLDTETQFLLRDSLRRLHGLLTRFEQPQPANNQVSLVEAVAGFLSSIRSTPKPPPAPPQVPDANAKD